MKRRPLNLLTFASLLLCVAVCVLWMRGYWVSDAVLLAGRRGEWGTQSLSGTWVFAETNVPHERATVRWDGFDSRLTSPWESGSPLSLPNHLGFGYRSTLLPTANMRVPNLEAGVRLPRVISTRMVLIPLWLPAAVFGLLPAARLYRRVCPRYGEGRCRGCGYDLRATPERCPECGAVASVTVV
jgi:hypothetical protein